MKKLLSMIGAMTLIGTASTSIIACGDKGDEPNPSPTPSILIKIFADLGTDKSFMLVFDSQGNLYSSTDGGSKIYKITSDGNKSVFADLGTDKSGMLVFDSQGNLYSSTYDGSKIYKITLK